MEEQQMQGGDDWQRVTIPLLHRLARCVVAEGYGQ